MKSIYTLTLSPSLDISSAVPNFMPEHKLRCDVPKIEAGGGGINVSRALKKIGGTSVAIFTAGGATGETFKEILSNEGIVQIPLPCKNRTRENFVVVETSTNQQYRFVMPATELLPEEWEHCRKVILENLPKMNYLVISGSAPSGMPEDFYASILMKAKATGTKIILDTSGKGVHEAINNGIYLLKPNTKELGELVGRELTTIKEQEEAAKEVIKKGKIEILVVSMGPSGAMIVNKDQIVNVSAPAVKKLSTVGAGDSMVAGLVWGLANNFSLRDTLSYGIACGTAATMNLGTALCSKSDVDKLFDWIKSNNQNV